MQLVSKGTVLQSVVLGPGDIVCRPRNKGGLKLRFSSNGGMATLVELKTPTYVKMPESSWAIVVKKVCFAAATSAVTSQCLASLAASSVGCVATPVLIAGSILVILVALKTAKTTENQDATVSVVGNTLTVGLTTSGGNLPAALLATALHVVFVRVFGGTSVAEDEAAVDNSWLTISRKVCRAVTTSPFTSSALIAAAKGIAATAVPVIPVIGSVLVVIAVLAYLRRQKEEDAAVSVLTGTFMRAMSTTGELDTAVMASAAHVVSTQALTANFFGGGSSSNDTMTVEEPQIINTATPNAVNVSELANDSAADLRKEGDALTQTSVDLAEEEKMMLEGIRPTLDGSNLKKRIDAIANKHGGAASNDVTQCVSHALQDYLRNVLDEQVRASHVGCNSHVSSQMKSVQTSSIRIAKQPSDVIKLQPDCISQKQRDEQLRKSLLENEAADKDEARKRRKNKKARAAVASLPVEVEDESGMDLTTLAKNDLKKKLLASHSSSRCIATGSIQLWLPHPSQIDYAAKNAYYRHLVYNKSVRLKTLPVVISKQRKGQKQRHKVLSSRKSVLYQNYSLLAPDGSLLCKCSKNKLEWYFEKNLATRVSATSAKFLFEPPGGILDSCQE